MKRQTKKQEPKSALQALFIRRVEEELLARGLSRNGLCERYKELKQKTFNDILNGADPRLEQVQKISNALVLHPWQLFVERADITGTQEAPKVLQFPPIPRLANVGKIAQKRTRYRNKKA